MSDESVAELQERLELLELEEAVIRARINLVTRRERASTTSTAIPIRTSPSTPNRAALVVGDLVSITNARPNSNFHDTFGVVVKLTKSRVHIRTRNYTFQRAYHNVIKLDTLPTVSSNHVDNSST